MSLKKKNSGSNRSRSKHHNSEIYQRKYHWHITTKSGWIRNCLDLNLYVSNIGSHCFIQHSLKTGVWKAVVWTLFPVKVQWTRFGKDVLPCDLTRRHGTFMYFLFSELAKKQRFNLFCDTINVLNVWQLQFFLKPSLSSSMHCFLQLR